MLIIIIIIIPGQCLWCCHHAVAALREFTLVHTESAAWRQVAADLWTKPIGLNHKPACRLPVNYAHHRHFIITQPKSWYSFYHPTEGRSRIYWMRVLQLRRTDSRNRLATTLWLRERKWNYSWCQNPSRKTDEENGLKTWPLNTAQGNAIDRLIQLQQPTQSQNLHAMMNLSTAYRQHHFNVNVKCWFI